MLLVVFLCGILSAQKAVSSEIQNLKSVGITFAKTDFLQFQTTDIHSREFNLEGLKQGAVLQLNEKAIQSLYQEQNEFISLEVPLTDRSGMVLTLKRRQLFTDDFKLFTSADPELAIEYTPGLHYMGIVEGDPTSLVAVSVYRDQVMAMIATDEGNLVIGRINGDVDNNHIIYNDRDLEADLSFECGMEDDGLEYTQEQLSAAQNNRDVNDCVRIYIEINDDIVTAKGGVVPATDYITGLFNQSFILFTNEQLTLNISEILAWTITSPYTGNSSNAMLSSYQLNTEFFNGDLSHLVSFDSIFEGVAASTSGICNADPDKSKCFSGLSHNYSIIPVYSPPVFLITHEMGHLLGSRHTQACVWNGNNTAIDGCAAPEGYCPRPPLPPDGGTLMSYCFASNGSYPNFNLGFGPQPGTIIRNTVNAASNCLTTCGQPTNYCSSNGANSSTEFIDKVILNSINNPSGNNGGYGNCTSMSTSLNAGNTYTITLTPKFTGGNKIKSWRVWIDYNHDFDWYDTGEMIAQGSGNNTQNLTFIVPANSISTTTRMRVSMKYTGYPSFCGAFPTGEVEDYTINIISVTPTCSDGIQNQGEAGIDCGVPCPACPTCNDGIQNQNETGVDCGGVCPACPQGDSTILLGSYFEAGLDSWVDGGSDVARVSSSNSYEGSYSIQLADNSGAQSAMTSPIFNLSDAVGLQINFHFKAVSMESGEDFWVQYKNGSGNWTTIGSFVAGTHFNNGSFYSATVTVPNFVPTSAGSLRIQCDASDNNDVIYIDAVTIVKLNGTEWIESGVTIQNVQKPGELLEGTLQTDEGSLLAYYPNPTNGMLTMELSSPASANMSFQVLSFTGQTLLTKKADPGKVMQQMDVYDLPQGLYMLQLRTEDHVISVVKFVKH